MLYVSGEQRSRNDGNYIRNRRAVCAENEWLGISKLSQGSVHDLEETEDRILATTISADWNYRGTNNDWPACRRIVRETLLEVFALHQSRSVQHTLYAMASAALDVCDGLQSITLRMPNQHRILVDLEPFGLVNSGELFVPTEAPQGIIKATVNRDKVS